MSFPSGEGGWTGTFKSPPFLIAFSEAKSETELFPESGPKDFWNPAVEKFSPKMGARFETYALVRIRGNIIDKIRSQDFLPRSVRRKIRDV